MQGTVCWVKEWEAGIEFANPLYPAVFDMVRSADEERRTRRMSPFLLVLDEGTTSTRAMLFRLTASMAGSAQRPLTQHYPAPG